MLLEDLGTSAFGIESGRRRKRKSSAGTVRPSTSCWCCRSAAQGSGTDQCMAFRQAFDERLYLWEFAHFIEYGLEAGDKGSLPMTERRILDTAFEGIAGHLSDRPRVLNHRDYHSWNLMVHDDAVVVIDFQDALQAPAQYDLASLLNDRETDQVVTPAVEEQLVNYYLERSGIGDSPGLPGTSSGTPTSWRPCNGTSRW